MLSINWRATAAYGYAKVIPPADFAWEYLVAMRTIIATSRQLPA